MSANKRSDDANAALPACQMGHTNIHLLLTFLTPSCMLVQNKTCTVEAPVEDDNEAAPTREEDGREAAMSAGAATTAKGSTQGREILGRISSSSTEGAVKVEFLRQPSTTGGQ